MSSTAHQSIYNLSYLRPPSNDAFPQFTRLPKEIRFQIWRHALQRSRIVHVTVDPSNDENLPRHIPYTTQNKLGKLVSDNGCRALVAGYRIFSKLLRVNSEARHEALLFYHIHIPCQIRDREGETKHSTIYLNPEYDFLYLDRPVRDTLQVIDFLHDLKAYDPQGIGLLNLAITGNGLNSLLEVQPTELVSPARTAFMETLSQLQEVFWVATPNTGRMNAGFLSSIQGAGVRFNSAFPITTRIPVFERLPRDPRPIEDDLRQVIIATSDPRKIISRWRQLLMNWDVQHTRPVQYRYILALSGNSQEGLVYDCSSAETRLRKESESWQGNLDKLSRFGLKRPPYRPSETVEAAFGFWLFPVKIDEDTPLGLSADIGIRSNHVLDLSKHWPELALSEFQ